MSLVAGGVNSDATVADFYFNRRGVYQKTSRSNSTKHVNQWVGLAETINDATTTKAPERVESEMNKIGLPFDKEAAKRIKGINAYTN